MIGTAISNIWLILLAQKHSQPLQHMPSERGGESDVNIGQLQLNTHHMSACSGFVYASESSLNSIHSLRQQSACRSSDNGKQAMFADASRSHAGKRLDGMCSCQGPRNQYLSIKFSPGLPLSSFLGGKIWQRLHSNRQAIRQLMNSYEAAMPGGTSV